MNKVIEDARTLRSSAIAFREKGDTPAAVRAHLEAIQLLRANLEQASDEAEGPLPPDGHIEASAAVSSYVLKLAEELAQQWGSLGGTYRAARNYGESIHAYDEGYRLETDSLYGHVDSYNLVQRLVARVLSDPPGWAAGRDVAGVNIDAALAQAWAEVKRQLRGPRKGDAWALADLAILCTLMGSEDEASAWADLQKQASKEYVRSATRNVLRDLSSRLAEPANRVSPRLGLLLARVQAAKRTLRPPPPR